MNWNYHEVLRNINIEKFFSAFEKDFKGGYVFPGETHDFWEILYVVEGNVCVSADDRVLNLSTDEIIFHKPMELHKFYVNPGSYAKLFIASFSATGPLMSEFENRAIKLSAVQKNYIFNIITLLRQNRIETDDCYATYIDAMRNSSVLSQMVACSFEFLLLSLHQNSSTVTEALDTSETIIFKTAVRIMEKHLYNWISVPELASECNVSISYLKKIFTKYAGLGIHKYFLKTKIILASQMLKNGKTVSETASDLSFSSQNYFSTVFKRETGIAPQIYKTKYK